MDCQMNNLQFVRPRLRRNEQGFRQSCTKLIDATLALRLFQRLEIELDARWRGVRSGIVRTVIDRHELLARAFDPNHLAVEQLVMTRNRRNLCFKVVLPECNEGSFCSPNTCYQANNADT